MPRPTTVISFGESSGSSNKVFYKLELDSQTNVDPYGNELTTFLDTEQVFLLLHLEPGAKVEQIESSDGDVINKSSPVKVRRTYTDEEVVFSSPDDKYQLPHYPVSGLTVSWKGRERSITRKDRDVQVTSWPGICSISYQYEAWQYILEVPLLGLTVGEDYPVDVSFKLVK